MYSLPVKVLWLSKCRYSETAVARHSHKYFHLFYIRGGKGIMYIGNESLVPKEGEIYFFRPGEIHGLISEGSEALNTIEVKFVISDAELDNSLKFHDNKVMCKDIGILSRLEELLLEALYKPKLYREVIETGFTRVLLDMLRNEENPLLDCNSALDTRSVNAGENNELSPVIDYIKNNYKEHISIRKLAGLINVSPEYLSSLFKRKLNISPAKYINNVRIVAAKELMMYSDLNITQISGTVGFNSVHYFSRYFKRKEKITAIEFKENVKENIYVYLEDKNFD